MEPRTITPAGALDVELELFFEEYREALGNFDAHAIASAYRIPSMIVDSSGVRVLTSEEELVASFEVVNERHRASGYTQAELIGKRLLVDTGEHILVRAKWAVLDEYDVRVSVIETSYTLAREDSGLKIVVARNRME